jgi:hypothetical protein
MEFKKLPTCECQINYFYKITILNLCLAQI